MVRLRHFASVVFPAPVAPITTIISPRRTVSDTSSRARALLIGVGEGEMLEANRLVGGESGCTEACHGSSTATPRPGAAAQSAGRRPKPTAAAPVPRHPCRWQRLARKGGCSEPLDSRLPATMPPMRRHGDDEQPDAAHEQRLHFSVAEDVAIAQLCALDARIDARRAATVPAPSR